MQAPRQRLPCPGRAHACAATRPSAEQVSSRVLASTPLLGRGQAVSQSLNLLRGEPAELLWTLSGQGLGSCHPRAVAAGRPSRLGSRSPESSRDRVALTGWSSRHAPELAVERVRSGLSGLRSAAPVTVQQCRRPVGEGRRRRPSAPLNARRAWGPRRSLAASRFLCSKERAGLTLVPVPTDAGPGL